MHFPSSSSTATPSASPRRCPHGFSLLETLVALAVLLTLTMLVASIYKHHTSAPATPEPTPVEMPTRPRNLSPTETPTLRDPVDTPLPSRQ
ncbi:prepilin-type N-terminal cleavage/methylation domain-containing protein [Verrucomicrobium spinosum]|uniref:prepilin-type N-terminal cleavage/methylation domain-containing protein n=1 Tax=Verrucomicrobium spinosum TaxID=2736 RepID=UPI0001746875|nr:prepilin-type N-terminal cleavage/methylation domain-containing protein [Verrucomicrobium spinosum]